MASKWFVELLHHSDGDESEDLMLKKKYASMDHVAEDVLLKRRRKELGDQLFESERKLTPLVRAQQQSRTL